MEEGPGSVPISIAVYNDATYIKHGIPILPMMIDREL